MRSASSRADPKTPSRLRRAANGVIKILAESGLPLTLAELEIHGHWNVCRVPSSGAAVFLKERLDYYLREVRGFAYDVVNAVLSTGMTTVADAVARAQALTQVRGSDDLVAISTAFKRIKNILRQAEEKQDDYGNTIASQDLTEAAEQHLYAETIRVAPAGGGSSRPAAVSAGAGKHRYATSRYRQLF